jgi:signal transduction histidine kinase
MREQSSTDATTDGGDGGGGESDPFAALPEPAVACERTADGWVVRATNDAYDRTFDGALGAGDPASGLPGADAFGDGLPTDEPATVEHEVDGEPRVFSVRASPAVVVYADVTDRENRLERIRTQRDRLDDFAGLLAHDLRNPLEVAMARTELARELGGDEHLAKTEAALDRIEAVVTELLELAREGAVVGETEPLSLSTVAREAWETVATGDATLTVADDATVEGDPGRVRELLENLFRNSVEHASTSSRTESGDSVEHGSTSSRTKSDDGGDAPAVEVGVVADGGPVGLYVADDGDGIPPEDREDVFKPGFSTDDEGTGFGLTVVQRIAAGHGWEVEVAESDAGGARFEVVDPTGEAFSSG